MEYNSLQTCLTTVEFMCYLGSYSVTCPPAEVNFPPLPSQITLVLDLATREEYKAELT